MVTGITSTTPVIPGIAGLGNLPAIAAYSSIIKKGEAKSLAAVASAPQVEKEQKYFESAIGRMDNVDDLLKDRRALTYLMTAYGLGSEVNKTGIISKVFKQDPSSPRSLVNSLADTRWRTMIRDIDTYNSGLGKIKGDVTKETFKASTIGNRYLQVMQLDSLGIATNTFYSNSFNLSVLSSGKIATAEGYVLGGYRLDNLGNIQQVDPNVAKNSVTVLTPELDKDKYNVKVGLDQTLTKVSGDTWQWTVTKGGEPKVSQLIDIKFSADGNILSVDGSTNFNKTVTLDWGANGTTSQSFDIKKIFDDNKARQISPVQVNWFDNKKTATSVITPSLELNSTQALANPDFFSNVVTKTVTNPDKASYTVTTPGPDGLDKSVKNTLTRVSGDTWKWKVEYGNNLLLEKNVDLTFDSNGKLLTVDGNSDTNLSETLDWGTEGTSTLNLDLKRVTDNSKETKEVALKQTFTRNSGDNWHWVVKDSDNNILHEEDLDLVFDTSGVLKTVNGNYNTSYEASLSFGGPAGNVKNTFDLKSSLHRTDFTQFVRATDNFGTDRTIRLDYSRTGSPENRWQVSIWYADTGTLVDTADFSFDSKGKISAVGKYNAGTGTIDADVEHTLGKNYTFNLDWQNGSGASQISLDFNGIFSRGGANIESAVTKTDSVALGKRKGIDIDENGNVVATYAKQNGTGDVKIKLYRLAANTFESPASLKHDDKTGYYTSTITSGYDNQRPLGTDKDLLGNIKDGFAGKLSEPAKTTSSKSVLELIAGGYNQNIFEQALGKENSALRYAVYFKNNASKINGVYDILGDRALRDVVLTVFNIPEKVATQPIETQAAVIERKVDVKKFKDPKFVEQFIQRFLALSNGSQGTQASGYQTSLLGGTDGSANAGSVLNLVAQNLNILT